jgi:hypothetical protein
MEAAQNDAMQQVERLVAVNEKLREVEKKLEQLKPTQLSRIEQLLVERAQLRASLQRYAAGAKHIEVAAEVGSYVNRTAFAIPAASSVAGSPGSGLQPMLAEVKALSEENALLRTRLQKEEQKAEQAPQEGASALGKHLLPAAVLPPASRLRSTAGSTSTGCSVGGGSYSVPGDSGSNGRKARTAAAAAAAVAAAAASDHDATDTDDELQQQQQQQQQQPVAAAAAAVAAAAASDHDATDTDDELQQQQQQQQQQPVAAAAAAAACTGGKSKGKGKGKRKAGRSAAKDKSAKRKALELRTYPLPAERVPVHTLPTNFGPQYKGRFIMMRFNDHESGSAMWDIGRLHALESAEEQLYWVWFYYTDVDGLSLEPTMRKVPLTREMYTVTHKRPMGSWYLLSSQH